jgi:hypothetical protein
LCIDRHASHAGTDHANLLVRIRQENALPSFHSSIPEDAIRKPAGIMFMHGDPDFLAALRMDEQHVAPFARALFDEARRL